MTAFSAMLDILPWWSPWASGLATVLGVLLRFRWLLALVPGVGPILLMGADAVVRGLGLIAAYILVPYLKLLGQGVWKALTSPHGLAVSITGGMAFTLFGLVLGVKLDAHLVRHANAERTKVEIKLDDANLQITDWKGRLDEQTKRAEAAKAAREKAESEAKANAARAAAERARRLRDAAGANTKAGPKEAAGSGLLGLSALFGGDS